MSTLENTPYLSPVGFQRAKSELIGTRFADLRAVTETGSTNADVRELLRARRPGDAAAAAPVVLVADHQTAGRGRLDRNWQAPPGASVLMSIGLPVDQLAPARRSLLTSALALAATDAGAQLGVSDLGIKWPNDLVVSRHDQPPLKVGGILAELVTSDAGDAVVLGIGLNANWPELPWDLADTATAFNQLLGHDVDREDLVVALLRSLDATWLPALDGPSAPDTLLSAYRERSATIGRRVRVELPTSTLLGTASSVTDEGALVVTDDDGAQHTVTVGDVVHLRPA
jgi:BirA family biotin operon repressor/biotin-[acetyl-CoA-carboxylase] ligase